jgi:hypothetical protein
MVGSLGDTATIYQQWYSTISRLTITRLEYLLWGQRAVIRTLESTLYRRVERSTRSVSFEDAESTHVLGIKSMTKDFWPVRADLRSSKELTNSRSQPQSLHIPLLAGPLGDSMTQ